MALNMSWLTNVSSVLGSYETTPIRGTYEIGKDDEGNRIITFDYSGEDKAEGAAEEGIALSFNQGKDDNGKYIEIDGVKLYEVK